MWLYSQKHPPIRLSRSVPKIEKTYEKDVDKIVMGLLQLLKFFLKVLSVFKVLSMISGDQTLTSKQWQNATPHELVVDLVLTNNASQYITRYKVNLVKAPNEVNTYVRICHGFICFCWSLFQVKIICLVK